MRGFEIPGACCKRDRSNPIYPFRTVGMKSYSHIIGDMISRLDQRERLSKTSLYEAVIHHVAISLRFAPKP